MASIFGGKIKDFSSSSQNLSVTNFWFLIWSDSRCICEIVAKRPIKLCAERSYAAAFEVRINSINQNTTLKGKKMLFFCQHALHLAYRRQKSKKSCVFSFEIYSRILEKSPMTFGPSSEQSLKTPPNPPSLLHEPNLLSPAKVKERKWSGPSINPPRQLWAFNEFPARRFNSVGFCHARERQNAPGTYFSLFRATTASELKDTVHPRCEGEQSLVLSFKLRFLPRFNQLFHCSAQFAFFELLAIHQDQVEWTAMFRAT